jgi:hypothetical protein
MIRPFADGEQRARTAAHASAWIKKPCSPLDVATALRAVLSATCSAASAHPSETSSCA